MNPCLTSSSSWMMSGRSRLSAYENVVKWKPGAELLGDRRAADEAAALEDERAQAGLGEVGAVDEAVVPAADDDRVVLLAVVFAMRCQAVFRSG